MKKYNREIKLLIVILVVMYLIPLIMYWTDFLQGTTLNNLLFVINPLTLFVTSALAAKKNGNFYIYSIGTAILFIPLAFTIYSSSYLPCFFLYIIVSLLGGLFGYWCSTTSEVAKAFKKAVGITAVLASLFTLAYLIIDIYLYQCEKTVCSFNELISFDNLLLIISIVLMVMLAVYCLKKDKKKE